MQNHHQVWLLGVCGCLVLAMGCQRKQAHQAAPAARLAAASSTSPTRARVAPRKRPTKRNINARFLASGVNVKSWDERFSSQKREVFLARQTIVDRLGLKKGQAVADLGAGTGVFIKSLRKAVGPKGQLFAVELSPAFVKHLKKLAKAKSYRNVSVVKSSPIATHLPDKSVDLVFVCATYHHFDQPIPMLRDIHRALRPGGRLAIVDYQRIPGVSSKWLLGHVKHNQQEVTAQITGQGFVVEKEVKLKALKENYFVIFRRK